MTKARRAVAAPQKRTPKIKSKAKAASKPKAAAQAKPEARIAKLERALANLNLQADRAAAWGAVQNVFARYQYLHCAFRDEEIIDMWVKPGTPGISAQYTNAGIYNTWESVTEYHRDRPNPVGKLLAHYLTSTLIEVAEDGKTAKGSWIVSGVEMGTSDPEVAANTPGAFYEEELVDGKKVWAHWILCRYAIDFLKQDGQWNIWHFRCVEMARAPFGKNWIAFAAGMQASQATHKFHNDLKLFGDDGKPVFLPPVDAPPKSIGRGYRTDANSLLEPPVPEPYRTFSETFEY